MFCTKCGFKNDDTAGFCSKCGTPLSSHPQAISPLSQEKLPEAGSKENAINRNTIPKPNNKKRLLLWLIPSALLILVAIVAASFLLKPKKVLVLDDILKALQGTLDSDSFAFDLDIAEANDESDQVHHADGLAEYDLAKGKLLVDIYADDASEFILYNDNAYILNNGELQGKSNLSLGLTYFFEFYEEYRGALTSFQDVDWEKAVKDSGLSSYLFKDEIADCMDELRDKLNDPAFLQEVCNKFERRIEKDETIYLFEFDTIKLTEEIYEILKPAFRKDYENEKNSLLKEAEAIRKCSLELTIGKGYLSSFSFHMKYTDGSDVESLTVNLRLKDYNKASFDKAKMKSITEMSPASHKNTDTTAPSPDRSAPTKPNTDSPAILPDAVAPTPIPARTEARNLEGDLELWYIPRLNNESIIADAVERFRAANPDCDVEVTAINITDYEDRLALAIAAGDLPDIFVTLNQHQFHSNIADGLILDITDFIEQYGYEDRYLEAALDQVSNMGRFYGVPGGGIRINGMFYHKELFNRLGLKVPETIHELEQICDTLLANGITPYSLGGLEEVYSEIYFSSLAARFSGEDPLLRIPYKDTASLEDGYLYAGEKLQLWIRNGYFKENFTETSDDEAYVAFANGESAMYLNANYRLTNLQGWMSESDLGFFAFPAFARGDEQSKYALGHSVDNIYSISSDSQQAEAAFGLISYLTDDIAIEQYDTNNFLSPLKDFTSDHPLTEEFLEIVRECDRMMDSYPTYLPMDAGEIYWNNLTELFHLSLEPQELFDRLAAAIQD